YQGALALFALEGGADGRLEERNDLRIVVGDRVDVEDALVVAVRHVIVVFVARHEAPAAVRRVLGRFAIHETDGLALHGDHVRREAPSDADCEWLEVFFGNSIRLGFAIHHDGDGIGTSAPQQRPETGVPRALPPLCLLRLETTVSGGRPFGRARGALRGNGLAV